jgi:hypothetical protein
MARWPENATYPRRALSSDDPGQDRALASDAQEPDPVGELLPARTSWPDGTRKPESRPALLKPKENVVLFTNMNSNMLTRVNQFLENLNAAGGTHKSFPHQANALGDVISAALMCGFISKDKTEDGNYVKIILTDAGKEHLERYLVFYNDDEVATEL